MEIDLDEVTLPDLVGVVDDVLVVEQVRRPQLGLGLVGDELPDWDDHSVLPEIFKSREILIPITSTIPFTKALTR